MIEAYMNATLDVLRLAGQMFLQRIDYELRRFGEDLLDFINDLDRNPRRDWRERFDAFLADQTARGREITPESCKELITYLEMWERNVFDYIVAHKHPSNPYLSYSLPARSQLDSEDISVAYEIALTVHKLRGAILDTELRLKQPSVIDEFNPFGQDGLDAIAELAELRVRRSELELMFTLLGYEDIEWSTLFQQPRFGLDGAIWHAPFAHPKHAIHNVTVDQLLIAQGVGGLASASKGVALRGLRRLALRRPPVAPRSRILSNKLAGDRARNAIAAREAPAVVEKTFKTVGGPRRVDVVKIGETRVGIESKVGRVSLTPEIRQELARDWWLRNQGQLDKIVWEFSRSAVTNKIGPTKPLLEKLKQLGFEVRIIE